MSGTTLRCHRKQQHSDQSGTKNSDLVTFPPKSGALGQPGTLFSMGQLEAALEPGL